MTEVIISSESKHRRQIADLIASVRTDTDTVTEMRALATHYRRIRDGLRLTIAEIVALDAEYGNDHEDIKCELRHVLSVIRSEELAMHEMCASVFGDQQQAV